VLQASASSHTSGPLLLLVFLQPAEFPAITTRQAGIFNTEPFTLLEKVLEAWCPPVDGT